MGSREGRGWVFVCVLCLPSLVAVSITAMARTSQVFALPLISPFCVYLFQKLLAAHILLHVDTFFAFGGFLASHAYRVLYLSQPRLFAPFDPPLVSNRLAACIMFSPPTPITHSPWKEVS